MIDPVALTALRKLECGVKPTDKEMRRLKSQHRFNIVMALSPLSAFITCLVLWFFEVTL